MNIKNWPMKKLTYSILLGTCVVAVAIPLNSYATRIANANQGQITGEQNQNQPKIQIAILLDTSGSMDGLLDQAREQLWKVVNTFAKASKNGVKPILEVAVFEYGNDGLSAENGYIRQVVSLTSNLDKVSEGLFSLKTNGGEEYCGLVINKAVNNLNWSTEKGDVKAIFIAGNEPFNQGPMQYQSSINNAKSKGIIVNTIHAGDYDEGSNSGWKDGALLAGGNYMSIDHNQQIVQIDTPYDQQLVQLNTQLNQTYIPYGNNGAVGNKRQMEQDANSAHSSPSVMAERTQSKVSQYYDNSDWDLVDAVEDGSIVVGKVEEEKLPEEMREMDTKERNEYVADKAKKRGDIQKQITEISDQRQTYIVEKKKEMGKKSDNSLDDVLIGAVYEQGKDKGFVF